MRTVGTPAGFGICWTIPAGHQPSRFERLEGSGQETGDPTSPSCKVAAICDWLNFLFFIGLPPTENPARKVHFRMSTDQGSLRKDAVCICTVWASGSNTDRRSGYRVVVRHRRTAEVAHTLERATGESCPNRESSLRSRCRRSTEHTQMAAMDRERTIVVLSGSGVRSMPDLATIGSVPKTDWSPLASGGFQRASRERKRGRSPFPLRSMDLTRPPWKSLERVKGTVPIIQPVD